MSRTPKAIYPPIRPRTLRTLRAYATEHGERWRAHLARDWGKGIEWDPALTTLRETHGPEWLVTFELPAAGAP